MVGAAGVSCGAGAAGAGSGGVTTCGVTTFWVTITRGNRSSNFVAGWSFAGPDLIAMMPRVIPSTLAQAPAVMKVAAR
jgi:hypothetical protein